MMSQNTNDVALTVLRKYDNNCQKIIDSCIKVKLYDYDKLKKDWVVKDENEGAFYIIKRNIPPVYKFFILSKYNKHGNNLPLTDIALSQFLISETNDAFYMFKNELGIIRAILFQNKAECDRLCAIINGIVNELKNESIKGSDFSGLNIKSDINSPIAGSDKIYSMLESARQKYEDNIRVEKYSRQIDINELFKSTTSANHNSHPSASINSFSPLSVESKLSQTKISNQKPLINSFIGKPITETNHDRPSTALQLNHSQTAAVVSASSLLPPQVSSSSQSKIIDHSMSSSANRNGPATNTLTVTELEKYLVLGAASDRIKCDPIDEDDDSELLGPNKFQENKGEHPEDHALTKEQLRDAMIHLLQNDANGSFIQQLHSAYLQSIKQRAKARK